MLAKAWTSGVGTPGVLELTAEGRGEEGSQVLSTGQVRGGQGTLQFLLNTQGPEEGDEGLRAPRPPGLVRVRQHGSDLLAHKLPAGLGSALGLREGSVSRPVFQAPGGAQRACLGPGVGRRRQLEQEWGLGLAGPLWSSTPPLAPRWEVLFAQGLGWGQTPRPQVDPWGWLHSENPDPDSASARRGTATAPCMTGGLCFSGRAQDAEGGGGLS